MTPTGRQAPENPWEVDPLEDTQQLDRREMPGLAATVAEGQLAQANTVRAPARSGLAATVVVGQLAHAKTILASPEPAPARPGPDHEDQGLGEAQAERLGVIIRRIHLIGG